jgi:hypothetical protein
MLISGAPEVSGEALCVIHLDESLPARKKIQKVIAGHDDPSAAVQKAAKGRRFL